MALRLQFCAADHRPNRVVLIAERDSRDLLHRAFPLRPSSRCRTSKRVLLVLDQAGWHSSQDLVVPEGIHLLFLPPYAPELPPCERMWPLSNEGVANGVFRSLDELEEAQVQRTPRQRCLPCRESHANQARRARSSASNGSMAATERGAIE